MMVKVEKEAKKGGEEAVAITVVAGRERKRERRRRRRKKRDENEREAVQTFSLRGLRNLRLRACRSSERVAGTTYLTHCL